MKNVLAAVMLMAGVLAANGALAGERTIKLSVPGMYCEACPFIVEKAVGAVEGVRAVEATIADKSAVVTFDDAVTTSDAILKATADIGYEASLMPSG